MAQRDLTNFRTVLPEGVDLGNSQLVSQVADLGIDIIKQQQQSKMIENFSKAQLELGKLNNDFQTQFESDPFNKEGRADFESKRKDILDELGSDINPFFRRDWDANARKLTQSNDLQIQSWGFKQARVNTMQSLSESASNFLDQAGFNGRDLASGKKTEAGLLLELSEAREQLTKFGNENLGETTTAEALKDFDSRYASNVIEGMLEVDPFKAKRVLNTKEFKDVLGFDNFDKLSNRADSLIRRRKNDALIAATAKQMVQGSRQADPANRKDRAIIEKGYRGSGLPELFAAGNRDAVKETVAIVKRTSIIPESAQSIIRGYMMNGTAEQKQQAYSFIGEIEQINPAALIGAGGFTKKEIMDAGAFNQIIRAGGTTRLAFDTIAKSNSIVDAPVTEMRDKQSSQILKDVTEADILNAFGTNIGITTIGEPSLPNTKDREQTIADYHAVYKAQYRQYANPEAAHGAAISAIKRNRGVSAVTGRDELIKYAPEDFYSDPRLTREENAEWMRNQLKETLRVTNPNINIDDVSLVASVSSDDRVANSRKPIYNVVHSGERNGFPFMDVLRGKDNNPLFIAFDSAGQRREFDKNQQRELNISIKQAKARKKLEEQREGRDSVFGFPVGHTMSGAPSTHFLLDFIEDNISDYNVRSGEIIKNEEVDKFNDLVDDFKQKLGKRK